MIRWCLYLRHQSNKAYDALRETGIALPSQRTLRDYTHSCNGSQKGLTSSWYSPPGSSPVKNGRNTWLC